MTKKTAEIELLVRDVLKTFSEPYGEDIIKEVCQKIDENFEWSRRYNELRDELGKKVVNPWIGRYTKNLTGLQTGRIVAMKQPAIIQSYSKLKA